MKDKFVLGAISSPHDPRDIIYSAVKPATVALPDKFLLPEWPVNSQGKYGTCVGQACSAIKDFQESKERGESIDTSPLFVYSLCKEIDELPDKEGTTPRAAMKVLSEHGICPERMMPYSLIKDAINPPEPDPNATIKAKEYVVKSYARVNSIEEIKQAVIHDGPVLAALMWVESMNSPEGKGFVPMPQGYIMGGHAVAITGWDDGLQYTYKYIGYKGNKTFKGFFRVRNSWGTEWGDNGYCWIPYGIFIETTDLAGPYFMEGWTAVDIVITPPPGPKPEPEPEPEGEVRYFDVAPIIIDGRTMLEMRDLAKLTGGAVEGWDNQNKQARIGYRDKIVYVNVGQKKYQVVKR